MCVCMRERGVCERVCVCKSERERCVCVRERERCERERRHHFSDLLKTENLRFYCRSSCSCLSSSSGLCL